MSDGNGKVDPQDPLPEANWFWRRLFSFAVVAALLYFVWGEVDRIGRVALVEPRYGLEALLTSNKWTIAFAGLVVTFYMLAPSAEQITKMLQTAGLLKSGVQFASRSIETPTKTETATTAGTPPQPVAPPVTDDSADQEEPDEPDTLNSGQNQGQGSDSSLPGAQTAISLPPPSSGLPVVDIVKGS